MNESDHSDTRLTIVEKWQRRRPPIQKSIFGQKASLDNFKMNESDRSDSRLTIFVQKRKMAKKTPTLTLKIFLGKQHLLKILR
jgi:hypothetical protein